MRTTVTKFTPIKIGFISLAVLSIFGFFQYYRWLRTARVEVTGAVWAMRFVTDATFSGPSQSLDDISSPNASDLKCEHVDRGKSVQMPSGQIKAKGWAVKSVRVVSDSSGSSKAIAARPDGVGVMMRVAGPTTELAVALTTSAIPSSAALVRVKDREFSCSASEISFHARNLHIRRGAIRGPVLESVPVQKVVFFDEETGSSTLERGLEVRIVPATSWFGPYEGKQIFIDKGAALRLNGPQQCDSTHTDQRCLQLDLEMPDPAAPLQIRLHGGVSSVEVATSGSATFTELVPGAFEWVLKTYATPIGWVSFATALFALIDLFRKRQRDEHRESGL